MVEEHAIEKMIMKNLNERRDINKNEYKFIKSFYKCYFNSMLNKDKIYDCIVN